MKHILKSWTESFQAIKNGRKVHELRNNDRTFQLNDVLVLREYNPELDFYSGRELEVLVTYITNETHTCALFDVAMNKNYCILSIALLESECREND